MAKIKEWRSRCGGKGTLKLYKGTGIKRQDSYIPKRFELLLEHYKLTEEQLMPPYLVEAYAPYVSKETMIFRCVNYMEWLYYRGREEAIKDYLPVSITEVLQRTIHDLYAHVINEEFAMRVICRTASKAYHDGAWHEHINQEPYTPFLMSHDIKATYPSTIVSLYVLGQSIPQSARANASDQNGNPS